MTRGPRPHLVKPSAFPQTLLTVSGIFMLNLIFTGESVDLVMSVVADAKVAPGRVNSAGLNDDKEQAQSERMLRPAIARVVPAPGFLTMIWLPTILQGTSV